MFQRLPIALAQVMLEYPNIKTFLQKAMFQISLKKFL